MALSSVVEGIWIDTDPMRILGMPLTVTMSVVRLANGQLLLYSPIAMTSERRQQVEALGKVGHLYAPNLYHHLFVGQWATAFPGARLHAPAGLVKKRPDLRIDRIHGDGNEPAFAGVLHEQPIQGFLLQESVLLHEPERTLIVADLVHNVGRPQQAWAKLYTRAMGFYDRVALSRLLRWTCFPDKRAARRCIDHLLARPFERLIVGHGTPVFGDAKTALGNAYAWLRVSR